MSAPPVRSSWPKPVARLFASISNFVLSTLEAANSTMKRHISTVTMSAYDTAQRSSGSSCDSSS
jgi:hypothetical protein